MPEVLFASVPVWLVLVGALTQLCFGVFLGWQLAYSRRVAVQTWQSYTAGYDMGQLDAHADLRTAARVAAITRTEDGW